MPRILLILFLLPITAFSQQKINLTLFGGFSNYSGDLQEQRFTLQQAHAAYGLGVSYAVTPKIYIHATLVKGQVSASDKFSPRPLNRERNLSFVSNIYEAAVTGEYAFNDLYEKKWTPYVFAGLAGFHFNPNANGVELRKLSTEGQGFIAGREPYNILALSIPLGFGVRVRITDNTYLGYEIGIRKTFTDYLDDVSKTYVDESLLLQNRGQTAVDFAFRSDELKPDLPYPAANTVRGSEKFKDWYYFSGITLSIGLGSAEGKIFGGRSRKGSVECPARVL